MSEIQRVIQDRDVSAAKDVLHQDYADTAVVLQRAFMRATVFDVPRDGVFVITDSWLREGGVWRVWKRHSTPLSAGELTLA